MLVKEEGKNTKSDKRKTAINIKKK